MFQLPALREFPSQQLKLHNGWHPIKKITRYVIDWENTTHNKKKKKQNKNQPVKTHSELINILELANKDIKIVVTALYVFKQLNRAMGDIKKDLNQTSIDENYNI